MNEREERMPKERQRRTLLHLPATLRTRRRHFPISRQASAPVLVHPLPFLPPPSPLHHLSPRPRSTHLSLVSSRSFVLFSKREEKMEARHETRKREERSLVGGAGGEKGGGERKRGATVSFGCNERTE